MAMGTHAHPVCPHIGANAEPPNLLSRPFRVSPTLIPQSRGSKSSHSRWENVKCRREAGN